MRERICKKIHRCPQYKNIPNYVRKGPQTVNRYYHSERDSRQPYVGLEYIVR